jgi:Tfp pilus assembly protein PilF
MARRFPGDDARALADFDAALRDVPDHRSSAPAHLGRGLILERRGEREAAKAAFEKALAVDPGNADARAGRDRLRGAAPR